MASTAVVVVFDFDKTIIDCDSDDWVVNHLGLRDVFEQLRPAMQWNPLMGRMMSELHSRDKSIEDIAECLRRAPVDPHVIEAIKTAYSLGCELRVVSDANLFFIETILKHHGLLECFAEINTNPSYVDDEGRLRILPCHDFTTSSHGCSLCPLNMCKGKIIDRIQSTSSTKGKNRFIYLGDGKGDYCPSLKLNQGDFVMPRKNYPLWNLILGNRHLLKAEVHEWSNGKELKMILLQLINRAMDGGDYMIPTTPVLSVDCKHVPVAVSGVEERPIPLRIPQ